MIIVDNKSCFGCRACEQCCPRHCISMHRDHEGFLIAKADEECCVHCNACDAICPMNKENQGLICYKAYSFHSNNFDQNSRSSSGGAFACIAQNFLENGGVVFGAAFLTKSRIGHISVKNINELWKLQGSKYVQSDTTRTYSEVKELLRKGQEVLYSGTACQIAGLKAFLGVEYENLLAVDVLCHGVASPVLFERYIEWLEKKNRKMVKHYFFREKDRGGWGHYGKIVFNDNESKYFTSNDPYIKAFMAGLTFRECCYLCKYAGIKRVSDITLCDFWGIQKTYPQRYRKDGVSGVLVQSAKGLSMIEQISDSAEIQEVDIDNIVRYQMNLKHPAERPQRRNQIYEGICDDINYFEQTISGIVTKKDYIQALIPVEIKYALKRRRKGF